MNFISRGLSNTMYSFSFASVSFLTPRAFYYVLLVKPLSLYFLMIDFHCIIVLPKMGVEILYSIGPLDS